MTTDYTHLTLTDMTEKEAIKMHTNINQAVATLDQAWGMFYDLKHRHSNSDTMKQFYQRKMDAAVDGRVALDVLKTEIDIVRAKEIAA